MPVAGPAVMLMVAAQDVVVAVNGLVTMFVTMFVTIVVAVLMAVPGVRRTVLGCGVGLAHGRRVPFRLGTSAGRAVGHRPPLTSIMCI
jgi:hypothetical protein